MQLPQELLEPLCQGLGHGLYRLRMYSHQGGTLVPAISMPLVGSPKVVGGTAKRDAAQPLREAIIGEHWVCDLIAEGFLRLCIQPVSSWLAMSFVRNTASHLLGHCSACQAHQHATS